MAEVMGESVFQALIQVTITLLEGLPTDTMGYIIRIIGICISIISIIYSWTTALLRLRLKKDPSLMNIVCCCRIICCCYNPDTPVNALTLGLRNTHDDASDNTPDAVSDNFSGDEPQDPLNNASHDTTDNTLDFPDNGPDIMFSFTLFIIVCIIIIIFFVVILNM